MSINTDGLLADQNATQAQILEYTQASNLSAMVHDSLMSAEEKKFNQTTEGISQTGDNIARSTQ